MTLKIGELARRTGLSVRALRHYDAIGLLVPSGRSEGGYRLYGPDDVARLYRIQALRRLDLSLAEIQALLDSGGGGLSDVVARQLTQLDREIHEASVLRAHLQAVQARLAARQAPGIDDWLAALERMTVGARYFVDAEPPRPAPGGIATEHHGGAAELHALMSAGLGPESPQAQALACQWLDGLLAESGGDEATLMTLHAMHWNEPSLQALTGVARGGMQYLARAMAFSRLERYAPHCTAREMDTLRRHYAARTDDWPPLIAAVRERMLAATPVDDPAVQSLARRWETLSLAKAGGDAVLQAKLRDAFDRDPALRAGSGIDAELADYIGRAIGRLGFPSTTE